MEGREGGVGDKREHVRKRGHSTVEKRALEGREGGVGDKREHVRKRGHSTLQWYERKRYGRNRKHRWK